jgi:perosamine synthetase
MEKKVGVGTSKISEKAKKYVNEALCNPWFIHGKFVKRLENEFAKLHGCKFGLVTNSGTSSLHIALQTLKEIHEWKDGDEVIVPAVTFVATSNIVTHNNMKPVFVDVEKDYYELDPKLIEEKITDRTRAMIPVHLFGQPCDMEPIMRMAKKHNLKIIEDSCETMFANYKNRPVGSFGDIGCFSMYVAHIISAGVGGINTTNKEQYAEKLISLMNHGRDTIFIDIGDDKGKRENDLREIVSRRFSFINIGHSFRVTEMEGAIGVAELEDHKENIRKRKENAKYLIDNLQELQDKIQLAAVRPETDHSFMMFPIVLKMQQKTGIVNYLENNGIETRDMLPLVNQPIYKKLFGINEDDYPVAKWINNNGFYVGCHQHLNIEDLDKIVTTIKSYFQEK